MKIYLVGGYVRDYLLGLKGSDKDYVVVGGSAKQLIDLGYIPVAAKNFPVFLNPITKEEYALARLEYKEGQGHKGFICDSNNKVTLKEDLLRRDLTINALAMDEEGKIYDYCHGINDLNAKIIRHINLSFKDDPLRIIRTARFYAKLSHLGFTIAQETEDLIIQMIANNELAHISPNRFLGEIYKVLVKANSNIFFTTLHKWGVFAKVDCLQELQFIKDFSYLSNLPPNCATYIGLSCLVYPLNSDQCFRIINKLPLTRQEHKIALLVNKHLSFVCNPSNHYDHIFSICKSQDLIDKLIEALETSLIVFKLSAPFMLKLKLIIKALKEDNYRKYLDPNNPRQSIINRKKTIIDSFINS